MTKNTSGAVSKSSQLNDLGIERGEIDNLSVPDVMQLITENLGFYEKEKTSTDILVLTKLLKKFGVTPDHKIEDVRKIMNKFIKESERTDVINALQAKLLADEYMDAVQELNSKRSDIISSEINSKARENLLRATNAKTNANLKAAISNMKEDIKLSDASS